VEGQVAQTVVTGEALWDRFKTVFRERLSHYCSRSCERRIRLAWGWPAARKQHYGGCILPRVADMLGMDMRYDYATDWRGADEPIDWAFVSKGAPPAASPLILVESENSQHNIGTRGVKKLAPVQAPLKVLLISWASPAPYAGELVTWRSAVQSYLPQDSVLAAIVGESVLAPDSGELESVRYFSHVLRLSGPEEDWVDEGVLIHFKCT